MTWSVCVCVFMYGQATESRWVIKKYEFLNKCDTLVFMIGSISMKSDLNKIDNMINNRVS